MATRINTLCIYIKNKGNINNKYLFYIGKVTKNDKVYKSYNNIGLSYNFCKKDQLFYQIIKILNKTIEKIKEAPDNLNYSIWEKTILKNFNNSPLSIVLSCYIKQIGKM